MSLLPGRLFFPGFQGLEIPSGLSKFYTQVLHAGTASSRWWTLDVSSLKPFLSLQFSESARLNQSVYIYI